jgi:Dolichyl-phosphate-mannose-protein mannosyltransferase
VECGELGRGRKELRLGEVIVPELGISDFANRKALLAGLSLVLLIGSFFRLPPALFSNHSAALYSLAVLHPNPKWEEMRLVGPDEELYHGYVEQLSNIGLGHYPDIIRGYIERQTESPGSLLPPVRFVFIFAGYLWHSLFHTDALASLRNTASLFNILTLALTAVVGWRMRGPIWSLGLTALVAFAPTQIHMSQHALIDGFFSFWALLTLWILWENLQSPERWPWRAAYTICLALLVLTKENWFFLWAAILLILLANRWLQYGRVTAPLLVATAVGPILGIAGLSLLAGGVDVLLETYRLLITKNYALPYAIKTGDGPWYRYLVDLFLVSPVVVILTIGAVFRIDRTKRAELFLLMFIVGSYLVMCNVRYGMNLRYANMWDVPLRFLALSMLADVTTPLQRRRNLTLGIAVAVICALELRQYLILFVEYPLHELASEGILRALHILK